MEAAILAVGSELLGTDRLDTNSLRLTRALHRFGVAVVSKAVVADEEERIVAALRSLLERADLVLVTGGLGPTADDVTREAVAALLGRRLHFDDEILQGIAAKFRSFGLRLPDVNRREAHVIDGAELLANSRGTAPGMRLDEGGRTLFLFPGVPAELDAMIELHLEPWLRARGDGAEVETVTLKVACVPESHVEERIQGAYEEFGRSSISILGSPGEVQLRLTASGGMAERRARLRPMVTRLRELVGDALFAEGADETLEGVVGGMLRAAGVTLGTAESCTGGLVSERLTRVPGSSSFFVGGVVAYSNALKQAVLGVSGELLERCGAVSEEAARGMAQGCRRVLGCDYGVAVTGIAGPDGGSAEKPVGTVHLAVAGPDGRLDHRRLRFPGDRLRVRQLSSQWALDLLRRRLIDDRGEPSP